MDRHEAVCPYDSAPASVMTDVHERYRLVGQAAQDMLDYPEDSPAVAGQLETDLMGQYGLMAEFQPAKAALLIARAVRAATLSAMNHAAQGGLNRKILPILEREEDLTAQSSYREGLPEKYALMMLGQPLADGSSAYVFTRAVYAWGMESVTGFRKDIATDPQHAYRPLADIAASAVRRYWQATADNGGEVIGSSEAENDAAGRADNSYTALRILLFAGLSAEHHDGTVEADGLARYASRHLGLLAMAASVNRPTFGKVAPKEVSLLFDRHEAGQDQADSLRHYATYFTEEGWAHPSLRRGVWPRPNCPGLLPLRSPHASERADADALFAHVESKHGHGLPRSEDGAYDQITALIGFIGLNIAEHTVYSEWRKVRPLTNIK